MGPIGDDAAWTLAQWAGVLFGALAPGALLGLASGTAAWWASVPSRTIARAALASTLAGFACFALASGAEGAAVEWRRFLSWPVAAWLVGAGIGAMVAASLREKRRLFPAAPPR